MKNKVLTGLGLAAAVTPAAANTIGEEKPNIVIIVADDLGWGDVGYHGSAFIRTPNIDRLVSRGVELDRFYSAPVSSPTRAGLLTGRYPSRFGIRETVIPPWREYGLDETEYTLADMLGESGYTDRALIGKWHLGHSRKAYYPLNRGFTHFYGHLNGAIDYFTHERDGELDWHRDWESSYDEGYSTDLLADEAADCIDRYSKGDPYFVCVTFNAPHSPFQAPEDELHKHISAEDFAKLNRQQQNGYIYRAMVTRLDTGVGEILDAIAKSGEEENTIVLFMSDNGGVNTIPLGSSSAPLRGHKFLEWDGGVRVCAAICWPCKFPAGTKIEQVTGFVDVMPTIAAITGAGSPPRPWDGINVLDVLTGGQKRIDRDMFLGAGAAVNNDYKMILAGRNEAMKLEGDFLSFFPDGRFEAVNDIADHPDEAARLKNYILSFDSIVPAFEELPYGFGQEGFKAPHEWKVVKP